MTWENCLAWCLKATGSQLCWFYPSLPGTSFIKEVSCLPCGDQPKNPSNNCEKSIGRHLDLFSPAEVLTNELCLRSFLRHKLDLKPGSKIRLGSTNLGKSNATTTTSLSFPLGRETISACNPAKGKSETSSLYRNPLRSGCASRGLTPDRSNLSFPFPPITFYILSFYSICSHFIVTLY